MPKIKLEQGSALFKYNDIGNNRSACFGCGNYGSRGLPIYRWMSCECSTAAPKFATAINKDNMSQCSSATNCYNPTIKTTINSKKSDRTYTNDNNYSYTNTQYLRRKCRIYERNLPVSTNAAGTKVYGNCSEDTTSCKGEITYKPNNSKFSTQGAVSGGERLLRLKYNTIAGDINSNNPDCCRKYTTYANNDITITKKEQICNNRGQKLRQHHTVCS